MSIATKHFCLNKIKIVLDKNSFLTCTHVFFLHLFLFRIKSDKYCFYEQRMC